MSFILKVNLFESNHCAPGSLTSIKNTSNSRANPAKGVFMRETAHSAEIRPTGVRNSYTAAAQKLRNSQEDCEQSGRQRRANLRHRRPIIW